ncbi:MAG TPA: hypothetical protein DD473_21955 [Planctomycetaceae bacterium]|nr:hypothetical protein [Planctomycetaceae bacterium]
MQSRTRKSKLKKNSRGWFPKEVGYLDITKRKQPKFNLGTDEKEAERRFTRIQELFDDCQRATGLPIWTSFGLYAAKLIAKGIYHIPFEFDLENEIEVFGFTELGDISANYVQRLRVEQNRYPSIHIIPEDKDVYKCGVRLSLELEQEVLSSTQKHYLDNGVIVPNRTRPEKFYTGTLHQAFDAYISHIMKTENRLDENTLKPSQRKRIEYVEVLKQHHPNSPLMHISTYDSVAELIGYWANRPEYQTGKRYKPTTARHRRKELERFLRWLDLTSEFDWEMPRGADNIRVRTVELEEDHEDTDLLTKVVYTPEQLGLLAKHANEFERFMLLVGVNCAFGAAEIGRLITSEVLLNHMHEFAERLHFESSDVDSFIRLKRPKSKMFGEWILWHETAEILRWAIERANRIGSPFLFITQKGAKIYDEKKRNPQSATANRWTRLIKRVQKSHADFPSLPYGSLRDTLPDMLRHMDKDSLASICLAHKTSYKADNLLEAYGNKPFGRLHDNIRELRNHFEPLLSASAQKR